MIEVSFGVAFAAPDLDDVQVIDAVRAGGHPGVIEVSFGVAFAAPDLT
ncbi:hypothetical protein JNW88_21885, partial [Micromonospora sp. ATA32]|nr:hypothetical protein [Micromonospora sp. ATA32]